MLSVIPQTRDEKIVMYMNLSKRDLAEMLVNCDAAMAAALIGKLPVMVGTHLQPGRVVTASDGWGHHRPDP